MIGGYVPKKSIKAPTPNEEELQSIHEFITEKEREFRIQQLEDIQKREELRNSKYKRTTVSEIYDQYKKEKLSVNGNRDPVIINNDINVKRLKIAIKELVNEHNMLFGDVSDIAVTRGPLSGGYKMIISFERRIDDEQL